MLKYSNSFSFFLGIVIAIVIIILFNKKKYIFSPREELTNTQAIDFELNKDEIILDAVKFKLGHEDFDKSCFVNLDKGRYILWSNWLLFGAKEEFGDILNLC